MSEQTNAKPSNQPSHLVYHVEDVDPASDKKANWTKLGAMWPHNDGKGFSMQLDFLPVGTDGRLAVRLNEPRQQANEPTQPAA